MSINKMPPIQRTLVVIPTYRCNAKCKDCGTASSPYDRSLSTTNTIRSAISQAKKLGFANIVFTGGEATLEMDLLLDGISFASKYELSTRLVTNAQWANNQESADSFIKAMKRIGLDEINYSTGDEHAVFINPENVVRACSAAIRQSVRVHLMIEKTKNSNLTSASLLSSLEAHNLPKDKVNRYFSYNESPWMPNKPQKIGHYEASEYLNVQNMGYRAGCTSVLQSYVVQPDGQVMACCGFGVRGNSIFIVGNVNDSQGLEQSILKGEENLFFKSIKEYGPALVLNEISKIDSAVKWQNKFSHECQACNRIFRDSEAWDIFQKNGDAIFNSLSKYHGIEEAASIAFTEHYSRNEVSAPP